MKFYLASSRPTIEFVKIYAEKLEALGHSITYKWWEDVEEHGEDDSAVDGEELFECAQSDMNGVLNCDVFWLLAPTEGGTGAWVELGAAIAKAAMSWEADDIMTEPHIVISGSHDRTLFSILNEVQECFETHEAAFGYISGPDIRTMRDVLEALERHVPADPPPPQTDLFGERGRRA